MKLPESVKVAGHVYEIRQRDADWRDNGGKHGTCDSTELQINVAMDKRWKETVRHEIYHAVCYEYCVSAAKNEEELCGILGTAWHQISVDNPKLIRALL